MTAPLGTDGGTTILLLGLVKLWPFCWAGGVATVLVGTDGGFCSAGRMTVPLGDWWQHGNIIAVSDAVALLFLGLVEL